MPAAARMQGLLVTAWRSCHLCICLQCISIPENLPVIWGTLGSSSIKNMEKEGAELAYCMLHVCVRMKQAALWLVWGHRAVRPRVVIWKVSCGFFLSP